MLESKRQSKIIKKLESDGWLVVKLIRTNCNGICDLMALKEGKTMFIEVKQPTGVLSEIQKIRIKQLKEQGFEVNVWTDYQVAFDIDLNVNIQNNII
jgi:Holliday junction resolvase-like predicted endonuclease